jgi:hypothetical protein
MTNDSQMTNGNVFIKKRYMQSHRTLFFRSLKCKPGFSTKLLFLTYDLCKLKPNEMNSYPLWFSMSVANSPQRTQRPQRKAQREEEEERESSILFSPISSPLFLSFSQCSFHLFSLRFLCGLCVSAVNGLC